MHGRGGSQLHRARGHRCPEGVRRRRGIRPPPTRRNNPACEANIEALIAAWRAAGRPIVHVRHEFDTHDWDFKDTITGEPDLLVSKTVHSAFYGSPDLHDWLRSRGLDAFAVCGITTDHCVETTARMGGDLGYDVLVVLDATHTFDRTGLDGTVVTADELARATAASLHEEFATVVSTSSLIEGSGQLPH